MSPRVPACPQDEHGRQPRAPARAPRAGAALSPPGGPRVPAGAGRGRGPAPGLQPDGAEEAGDNDPAEPGEPRAGLVPSPVLSSTPSTCPQPRSSCPQPHPCCPQPPPLCPPPHLSCPQPHPSVPDPVPKPCPLCPQLLLFCPPPSPNPVPPVPKPFLWPCPLLSPPHRSCPQAHGCHHTVSPPGSANELPVPPHQQGRDDNDTGMAMPPSRCHQSGGATTTSVAHSSQCYCHQAGDAGATTEPPSQQCHPPCVTKLVVSLSPCHQAGSATTAMPPGQWCP